MNTILNLTISQLQLHIGLPFIGIAVNQFVCVPFSQSKADSVYQSTGQPPSPPTQRYMSHQRSLRHRAKRTSQWEAILAGCYDMKACIRPSLRHLSVRGLVRYQSAHSSINPRGLLNKVLYGEARQISELDIIFPLQILQLVRPPCHFFQFTDLFAHFLAFIIVGIVVLVYCLISITWRIFF